MKIRSSLLFIIVLFFMTLPSPSAADDIQSIDEFTKNLQQEEGFFTYYTHPDAGKVYLEIDKWNQPFIYVNYLSTGVGSNDIGLDRGQIGDTRMVHFERHGQKVLLIQPNLTYRAGTENDREKQSVDEAFAQSVLWGGKVVARTKDRVLVDMEDFLLRDAHGVTERLKASSQGAYRLDKSRSAPYLPQTMNFPDNTEFEAMLTFEGDASGGWIRSVTPTPNAVSVRMHHSFVRAPDDHYEPRSFHPRAGYFARSYKDYSVPVGDDMTRRFITRHRLKKKNPDAEMSKPVEPIVYYLDPGTPEPVRTALLDGARWWSEAFEAAGFRDAFEVKMLPPDAHPLDVRYNMIQWVHRSTRGWSYGMSVVDPRTGEILKGHVSLGSLRVRQDYLIAEGLLAPYEDGEEVTPENDPMLAMALDRIRQLSAHEIGHTLGLAHNFASSVNGRASVMDYPHPKVNITESGELDLSQAYDIGVGEWDKLAIRYGYSDVTPDREEQHLQEIINEGIERNLLFISDRDARPLGGAHPEAHLWDNGVNAAEQLGHIMKVRRKALEQFSEANIKQGEPMATLEEVLVPIYLYHRYQVEAAAKLVGGVDYAYNMRGDGLAGPKQVSERIQNSALSALLRTISPEALAMPEQVLEIISPRPLGYPSGRETFDGQTGVTFDPYAAAESAAQLTLGALLQQDRAMRMIQQHAHNSDLPSFQQLLDQILKTTWYAQQKDGYAGNLQRTVNHTALHTMLDLAAQEDLPELVKADLHAKLRELKNSLAEMDTEVEVELHRSSIAYAMAEIERFFEHPDTFEPAETVDPPPGSPIGAGVEAGDGADWFRQFDQK